MKQIVILGGGFGGLRTALDLARGLSTLPCREDYQITLIDRTHYHTFTPLLYEIATTAPETADYQTLASLVAYPFSELLKNTCVQFIHDEISHVDVNNRVVHSAHHTLPFDYLVIALGAEPSFFSIPGLKDHALTFKTLHDALSIRDAILSFSHHNPHPLRIVIAGGGPTGVELASEIKNAEQASCRVCRQNSVTLLDSNSSILSAFHPRIAQRATQRLKKIGVHLCCGSALKEVYAHELVLENNTRMAFDILIWAGGVKAATLADTMPFQKEARGRIAVHELMQCIPENADLSVAHQIYALGDLSCIVNPRTKKTAGQVAPAAVYQGAIVAHNILQSIKQQEGFIQKSHFRTYIPQEYPYILPLGGKYGLAKIGPFIISGFFAWIFKGIVELHYFFSIMPFWTALTLWIKGLNVFIKNDRLG